MATGVRVGITLACTECKRRNYETNKSKRNTPDRVELRKYCRWCGRHTAHRETRYVARSRQQRRERRAAQGLEPAVAAGAAAPPASPPGRPTARGGGEPERERRRAEARVEAAPRAGFVRESVAELKKVEWPSRQQVITGTVVVIIAVAIVGVYLWLADQAFKNLVEKVLI